MPDETNDRAPDESPATDTPAGDMPAGDMPAGDMPAGDMPAGDMPAGDMPAGDMPLVIGLISDTHGEVRADVHRALAGVAFILHAGDVCGDDVLMELDLIAPTVAVAGNCDPLDDPRLVRQIERVERGVRIHVSHGHELGVPTVAGLLATYDADVIVYGHTHRPLLARAGGRLVVNPGAAGPRRFDIVPSVGRLTISADGTFDVELVELAY